MELAIPQLISPQGKGTAAMAKSVYFKVRASTYSPSLFGFSFIDLFSRISWGDIRPIALHGGSREPYF